MTNTDTLPVVSLAEAEAQGYSVLSGPYNLSSEGWMLDNAIADLQRGRRDFLLVRELSFRPSEITIFTKGHR